MIQVSQSEAQDRLPDLLAAAEAGQGVEICGDNGRTFRLSANRPRPSVTGVPRAGSAQGLIEITDEFDTPLEELGEYWRTSVTFLLPVS